MATGPCAWLRSTTPARCRPAWPRRGFCGPRATARSSCSRRSPGVRVRRANFIYGSSKAGADGFAQGLADSLAGTGVDVLIVRPGFVRTKMTEGRPEAPFTTTAEAVAEGTVRALATGRAVVWVPPILRLAFAVMRFLPRGVWRRLPG